MSYDELASHATEIKQLCIDKTVEMYMKAGGRGAAYAYNTYVDQAEQTFADTDSVFDDWLDLPDPWLLDGGLGNISAALPYLSSESYLTDETAREYAGGGGTSFNISQIEPTGAFMQGWTSGTSLSYSTFAGLFGPVTSNLSMCANVLRGACEAELAIWTAARDDIDKLAHATIEALNSVTDKDPKSVTTALAVIGAVAGIVAVPFTAGGSLAASYTFAAIAAGTSIGGAFVPEKEETESAVSGGSPREIIESLQEQMTKLNDDIKLKETDVEEALRDSADDFEAALALPPGQSPVKMPRPSVADDPSFGGRE